MGWAKWAYEAWYITTEKERDGDYDDGNDTKKRRLRRKRRWCGAALLLLVYRGPLTRNSNPSTFFSIQFGIMDSGLVSGQRRCSPRLKDIPRTKRPYYGTSPKVLRQNANVIGNNDVNVSNGGLHLDPQTPNAAGRYSTATTTVDDTSSPLDYEASVQASNHTVFNGSNSSPSLDRKSAYALVKETIRTFNTYYLQLVQKMDSCAEHVKASEQFDLKVLSKMLETNSIMYPRKRFGHLPGIDIGYQFHSRAEMVALGFHSHLLYDIDYMEEYCSEMEEYKGLTFPLAVAIVLSSEFDDPQEDSEDVIYTDQVGHNHIGSEKEINNQVVFYSNLVLKNNMEQSVPIRVVRGHEANSLHRESVYTYHGLYKVMESWTDKGLAGLLVYKFRLRRLEGQPKLTTNQVFSTKGDTFGAPSKLPGVLCMDISGGKEEIRIPVINLVDDTPFVATGFTYSRFIQVAENVDLPPNADGCKCNGNCMHPKNCACAQLNGSKFPYVRHNGGRLKKAKDVVFECGPKCGCGPDCINRISQRGIKYQLEVFRTLDKGWAVRTKDFIPSGAPVCEYIGILKRTDELDNVDVNDYIFEIDCLHTIKGIEGRERRFGAVSVPLCDHIEKIKDGYLEKTPEFCIDASTIGNVSRYINHSCEPNLFVQCILSTHHDVRLARIVLFAAGSISPLQELTYDYGYQLDSVIGRDGKVKEQPCFCGTQDCRKRLY
ncbi:hypothetical protein ACH5RR_035409 [Cinchona calisaya]|uniref:Uncharacterized protein n=1 Tax=Cinchona calisaya TaxID=153742 RepID=A0ABD2Y2H9_9GENT